MARSSLSALVAAWCFVCGMLGTMPAFADSVSAAAGRWSALAQPDFRHVPQNRGEAEFWSIAQDREGFLWFGKVDGLLRWDGYRYRKYRFDANDPASLPDDRAWLLHTDAAGRLWVGTLGGLARYDDLHDNFIRVQLGSDKHSNIIHAIHDDRSGGLLVTDDAGVDHLGSDGRILDHLGEGDRGLPHTTLYVAMRDRDGRLWVGTGSGLFVESAPGGRFDPVALPVGDGRAPRIHGILQAEDGRIWVGTYSRGAYVVERDAHTARAIASDLLETGGELYVTGMTEARHGEMWVATMRYGILAVDTATLAVHRLKHDDNLPASLVSDSVHGLFRDPRGQLWVASDDGIDSVDLGRPVLRAVGSIANPAGLANAKVEAVGVADDGRIVLSLMNDQIYLVDATATHIAALPSHPGASYPKTITYQFSGQIGNEMYAATQTGLYRVDLRDGNTRRVAAMGDQECRAVIKDGSDIWAGCNTGLWLIRPGADGETVQRAPGAEVIQSGITDLFLDHGVLWLSTWGQRLYRYDQASGTFKSFNLPSDVSTLLVDSHRRLWVGTFAGLYLADKASDSPELKRLEGQDGRKQFGALLEDDSGNIWGSGDGGLTVIDGTTLATRQLSHGDWVESAIYYISGAKTSHGELLFSAKGGLAVLRPALYTESDSVPPVVVTDIQVGGKPVSATVYNGPAAAKAAPVAVAPDANSFAVEFSALDYTAPELNRYAYRLEGYDKEWQQTDSGRRVAAYTNLSPGNYRLLLRGSNHNGLWNDKEFALPLRILPAWYQTWWAHLAELAAVLAAMALFVQLRTRYLRKKRKELEHVVKERTAELTEKNSELAHLNSLQAERQSELTRFLAVASHDLRQPMHALNIYLGALLNVDVPLNARTLLGKVRQCASIMDDMFLALLDLSRLDAGVVRPNVKRFAIATVLKTLMIEFLPQAEAKGLTLECALPEEWVESDANLVQQILGNLIANAVRYTEKGGIRISCRTANGRLLVSVADSGIGIPLHHQKTIFEEFLQLGNSGHDRTKGLGLGLAIVKRLSRLLGTPVTLVSEAGKGATFTLDLPLAEAHQGDLPRLIGEGQENSKALEDKLAVVIDDERSILDSTRILLEQWGCRVITAQSSDEAKAALGDQAPDVLICDYRLPNGESGIEAIRAFIEEFNRDIPALVITGDTAPDLIRDTLSTGWPVMYKPLQAAALREALLRLVTARAVII